MKLSINGVLCGVSVCSSLARAWPNSPVREENGTESSQQVKKSSPGRDSPSSTFPDPEDPFHFVPCTKNLTIPGLKAKDPVSEWTGSWDSEPENWEWSWDTGINLCGYFDAPLDYTNSSDDRIVRLSVAKYQAGASQSEKNVGQKSNRTILFNPGGPGGSGTASIRESGSFISQDLSNGEFDVLGWDPRGVAGSLPSISCYPYNEDADRWYMFAYQDRESAGDPLHQLKIMDAMNNATMQSCWERYGDVGNFLSTAFVARDVDAMREALGEPELTAYMASYGTGILQTYVSMFPEHAGRLILDGPMYLKDNEVFAATAKETTANMTDAWDDGVLGECLRAGPEACALAQPIDDEEVTLELLKKRTRSIFDTLAENPIPVSLAGVSGPNVVTHTMLMGLSLHALYAPRYWPSLAGALVATEQGDTTPWLDMEGMWEYSPKWPNANPQLQSDELFYMVMCSDGYISGQPDALGEWDDLWAEMVEDSWIGGSIWFTQTVPCRHYNTHWTPAEVNNGQLAESLKTPVLIVAGTHDPATPLHSGKRLRDDMGDSARLVVHHGYGHCSNADPSECTNRIMKEYMLKGTLPEDQETDCYADYKPYASFHGGRLWPFYATGQDLDPKEAWHRSIRETRALSPYSFRSL